MKGIKLFLRKNTLENREERIPASKQIAFQIGNKQKLKNVRYYVRENDII